MERITEMELKIGRACRIIVECPYCPEFLAIDPDTGRVEKFKETSVKKSDIGGIVWDMTHTEESKGKVKKLIEEGNQLVQTDVIRAETLFRKAVAIRKHEPLAWYNIGVCRHRMHDLVGAEKSYRHALEFDPTFIQAWNNLGTCLVEQNRLEEGEECFDQGITINADNPKFYLGKANIAGMRRDFATARKFLNIVLEKDPNYQPAYEGLKRMSMLEKYFKENDLTH